MFLVDALARFFVLRLVHMLVELGLISLLLFCLQNQFQFRSAVPIHLDARRRTLGGLSAKRCQSLLLPLSKILGSLVHLRALGPIFRLLFSEGGVYLGTRLGGVRLGIYLGIHRGGVCLGIHLGGIVHAPKRVNTLMQRG